MFDIGWTEMALIAVVAVVVIGPKELPKVMREMGYWVSRARAMSRTFMDQLEEMSRQSGIDEVRKEVEAVRKLNPAREIEKAIDPDGALDRQMSDLATIGSTAIEPPVPTALPEAPPETPSAVESLPPAAESAKLTDTPADLTEAEPEHPATPRGPGGSAS